MTPYSCGIFTLIHHVQKLNICAMVGIFLSPSGTTEGAFVIAERFIDTVDIFQAYGTSESHC